MPLVSLVYVSRAIVPMSDEELKQLLKESRENNDSVGITGMLLYRDGFFIQALEGEQHDVDALYDKIKSDPRHTNVLKVYEYEIDHTDFGAWSMGFNKISAEDMDTIPGFSDFLNSKQDPETYFSTPSRAVKLLAAFKERTYF